LGNAAALACNCQNVRCAWHPTRQKPIGEFVSETLKNIVKGLSSFSSLAIFAAIRRASSRRLFAVLKAIKL
jgi:hypothetical protein